MERALGIYGGRDPRTIPNYTLGEAAHYLRAPYSTLRSWSRGQRYATKLGQRSVAPAIELDDPEGKLLSFTNLVELHVLTRLRREPGLQSPKVRQAVRYVSERLGGQHPLATQQFQTGGIDLLVERYGRLVAASERGQLALRDAVADALHRLERDDEGLAARLFPYTRLHDSPRLVVVDPLVAFGRPVLVGTGIPTAIVAERFSAGESIASLARDYARRAAEIEEAVRCELPFVVDSAAATTVAERFWAGEEVASLARDCGRRAPEIEEAIRGHPRMAA